VYRSRACIHGVSSDLNRGAPGVDRRVFAAIYRVALRERLTW
jgi:hypothetical protein